MEHEVENEILDIISRLLGGQTHHIQRMGKISVYCPVG